nr:cartilage intermediate layer protein-like isoform X1 [Ciona intestinalis]|eukprot:XP_018672832.1 cartilage intermediate layer protein-like isoform X1 [Ciona intestinalis]
MDNGEWSHPVPRCDDKNECQQANPPCHQHADCVNEVGSYTCTCRDGFVGNGITCTVPVCRPVTRPTHGTFSTSDPVWRVGTEVTFQCSNGYSLVGSATITCLTGAVWSHRIPACHDVDECIDPNIECNEQASCSNTNGGYNCVCNRGYSGDGQVCTLVTCEEPLSTSHGSFSPLVVQGPRQYNHAVTYHCYDGFILEGASTAVCQQNGQWSNPPPTCRRDIPDVRWCTASGDPHYDTFDGQHYEFQGQCLYDFIKSTNVAHAAGHPQLTVQTENERRFGLTHVTWLKKAIIRLPNIVIELRKALVVLINGIQTTLSYDDPASGVSVRISGRYVTITTSFGMRLRYDGNHYLTIGLPASYAGAVEGLCGNYNGDPTDDMIDRSTGQVASSSVAFGNSYQINSADECAAASATTSACTAAQRADYEAQCSIITNPNGCFSECHSIVPPETSFQNCVFDLCAFNGEKASLVENVAAYATDCQANGITPCIWRNVIGAPLNCTANSQYKLCTSACPNTCVDATASSSCSDVCTEGCECDDGFIMSGTFCVPFSQCGCVDNGRYYMNDESFYTANCERHCDCLNGQLLCSDAGCRTGEKCGADDDGRLRCLQPTSSCNEVPIGKNIRLPPSCAVTYFDVGACPSVVCPGTNFFETQCCGVVERRMVQVDCGNGETISVSKVTRCGCSTCIKQTITVSGKVYGLNADGTEMPLSHGTVIRNNRSAATTDVNGKFSLNVDSDVDRLVLTFVDRFRRLMTTTKILEFKRLGGAIFHNIRVPLKESVHNFISTDRGDFHPTSHGRTSVINIMVEPNSYFQKSGSSYNGRVRSSITYIDPRDVSSYLEAPSDLRTEDGRVMRSYGMFELDFRNFQNYELDVRNIRISLQASEVGILSEQRQMRMWSLNPVNGLWYDEGEMALISSAQGMQLTANIALVQTRRLLNIDVASPRTCYAKVRAYGSDAFNIWDQVSYILVDAVFREATDSRWRNFGSSLTLPNSGACLRVFCDVADSNAFTATFTASLNAEKSLDAASSINQDSAIIGVSDEILPLINYRRSGHGGSHQDTTSFTINLPQTSNVTHLDGPFYRDQFDCLTAPVTHDHFRFSMKPSALFEFNTIPIDENNIFFTWQNTPLIWWPRPNQFRSCYMKVKIIGTANAVVVESRNTVGSRQDVLHQLYGIREDSSVSNGVESTACIEFKCSGVSLDQQTDQTVVDITPRGSCSRTNVNVLLTNYLTERNSLADQVSIASFKMFAPTDPLGHNYGIYTVTTSDPITSKQLSKGRCMAGQSSITSSVMQVDNNVAVTFNCGSH